MKLPLSKNTGSLMSRQKAMINLLRFTCILFLVTGLYACGGLSDKGGYTFSEKHKRIKLGIGEIKEVTLTSQRDSSWTMIGSSENKEIVDVTSKEDPSEETTTTTIPDKGSLVFLVKGVTNGRVRINFAEKRKGETGPGRTLKTYMVDVVSK
jgi:hypothetical protein